MDLDPEIWGPNYWFFLRSIAMIYPKFPNAVTKKKYYDLITSFSLYIPNKQISKNFDLLLNKYPLSPYLTDRDSLCSWIWFINNKINIELQKPTIPLEKFYTNYYDMYKNKNAIKLKEKYKILKKISYFIILLFLVFSCYYFYKK